MSFNQSRSDKSEQQYRKTGRSASFNQQRSSSGAYGKGGGPAPTPASTSLSSNRSFKKTNNAQGGPSRVTVPVVNSSDSGNPSASRNLQNGAHLLPSLHGASDAPVASRVTKPNEASASQRSTRGVPKAPTSQSASVSSENAAPPAPSRVLGDGSPFTLQFGSISAGFMQVPARTSSAPPNLDEQKRDQARHDAFRTVPPLPNPAPKQQLQRKDVKTVDQTNTTSGEALSVPKVNKDTQVSPAPPVNQMQKPSVLPIPITSMQIPFHQQQVPVLFGGTNSQMPSQGVTATSLQMPMGIPLPMGSAPQVQQPMFVQGIQPHPMQPQGIMHQGQSLSFTTPIAGPQLPPQLGSLGIGMTSQYPQQQGGKFGSQRKTPVKIIDPKTHEELRLDKRADAYVDAGSSGLRPHPSAPHSQPIPSFAPSHPMNYYSNSYNANNLFFPAPSSLPLANSQMPPNSQPSRFSYPVSQSPQNLSFMNPSVLSTLPVNKSSTSTHGVAETPSSELARNVHNIVSSAPSGTVQVTVKPAAASVGEKAVDPPLSNSSSAVEKGESNKSSRPSGEGSSSYPQRDSGAPSASSLLQPKLGSESLASKPLSMAAKQSTVVSADNVLSSSLSSASPVQSEESVPAVTNAEGRRREPLNRSNSVKDHQKKLGKKGYIQSQHQISGQSTSTASFSSPILEHGSSGTETIESKTIVTSSASSEALTESIQESAAAIGVSTSDASETKFDNAGVGFAGVSSEISGVSFLRTSDDSHAKLDGSSCQQVVTPGIGESQGKILSESPKQDDNILEISSVPLASKSAELFRQNNEESGLTAKAFADVVSPTETVQEGLEETGTCHTENDRLSGNRDVFTSGNLNSTDVGKSQGDYTSIVDVSSCQSDNMGSNEVSVTKSGVSHQSVAPFETTDLSEASSKHDGDGVENAGGASVSAAVSVSRDKSVDLARAKSITAKGKKKKKEILQKADAQGMTSDLYVAFKAPEEKKENVVSSEVREITPASSNLKQVPDDSLQVHSVVSEKNKAEPDDWEDAAEISTPNLENSDNGEQSHGGLMQHDKDGSANTAKKYSRDFLLKFWDQCTDLPETFEITSDIAEALMSHGVSHLVDLDSYPSPGRGIDRSNSGSRIDRRGSGMVDDDRWSKLPGPFPPGRDLRLDIGYGNNIGFRPGQGGNYGVLRNPRAQTPVQYVGGILSGPMQAMGAQAGMQRNSSDADRWQRATNFQQKGLIPSPQTPLQMMHKAEKKYEVGKVTDEEQAKQRQLKAILNKLTPQNFEKLFEQVKAVNIDNAVTLTGVISQIFDKALMEPTFCEMYADFCYHLAGELPDFSEDNQKITFKRLLLNKCQEEFERGEREQEEANKAEEEGEIKQSNEEREEKRIKARRRMLGNIRLIGELYKKKMLTERIMHECIKKLLGQYQNPDEEDVEALCKLMSTIGEIIDHPKAKEHMDAYFDMMTKLSNNTKLSSRVRFMLKDAIDLRKNKWQQRRKVEGPKKIEEVHRDAAQERQLQTSRLARNPGINPSGRRAPMDFGPRGSTILSSPNSQMGGFRGITTPVRGYGSQDVRFEERQSYEARTLSVPLPQRPLGDDSLTLGPQGGLARGMSIRGLPAIASTPLADMSPSPGESRRVTAGLNGFSNISERPPYNPREDLISRYASDGFEGPAAYDQLSVQERNLNYVNRDLRNVDRGLDRSLATSPPARAQGPVFTQNVPLEKIWPEERLRDMSMAAIKEFYSARDEQEVALCIKDLNSPSFHPSMISLWVTDSFERKDIERDLLAKLLVNLTRSRDGILTPPHLMKGFESVLTTLEDAVNDAPKAAEFLGRIFAKIVLENVVPLWEIGRLLHEGGEEPGRLLEVGLAGDVLGSTLQIIKVEKGESVLNEIRSSSNLQLEDFQPPEPNRSRILENFI